MSGFVAILDTTGASADKRLVRTMLAVPPFDAHQADVWTRGGTALGSAPLGTPYRLEKPQPLSRADLTVVMDGRLDDRAAIVRMFEADLGRRFSAASDVELVLAAYERWGTECASHLIGDFAFCVWDEARRHLFCVRDHLGVKPLYYARIGTTLVVSNVMRSIRRHPEVSTRFDEEAIGDFLLFWTCLEPSRTSFADIARVPPAHTLTVSASGASRLGRYWSLEPGESLRLRHPQEYVERYLSTLEVVVGDRVRSAPAGILMSGGLDSSSVAAAAARVLGAATPVTMRAHTAVYDTVEEDRERHYSTLVARALGIPIEHHPMDGYRWFERWNESLLPPEPSMEPMTAMMADLLDHVSRHAAVVLTGDGGDPALLPSTLVGLAGRVAPGLLVRDLWRSLGRVRSLPPIGVRSAIKEWWSPPPTIVPPWLTDSFRARVDPEARVSEIARRRAPAGGPRGAALAAVIDPWWTAMFEAHDPGATLRPVELRYPLFDVRFVTFALTLPTHPWCVNKEIVRSAMSMLPDEIRVRPKSPLAADPIAVHGSWTRQQAVEAIEAVPELAGYVDFNKFREMVRDEGLLTEEQPGTLPAVALATWLRCAASMSTAA
jgi:asparagine synthase (glutamine-hydrolysing)